MNEIIKVDFDSQTVSARDLYESVGSTERFSAWFERQLQYGFEEGRDFVGCKTFNALAHQELQDYSLTIDMAKEICMVQKNEKSRRVRQYLIDLEKAWNTPELVMARGLRVAQQMLEQKDEQIKALTADNERMKPKEIFTDAVTASDTSILVRDLAKIIKQNGIDIGEKRLYKWMREHGFIIKGSCEPTQKAMERGLFEVVESTIQRGDLPPRVTRTTKVTGKGQVYFIQKFLGD